jgi:hypothetical protein
MTMPPEPPSSDQPPAYGQVPQPPSSAQPPQPPQPPTGWTPPPGYYGYAPAQPNDGQAVAAMVLGIIALVGMCAYGIPLLLAPVALFLGRASMKRIDASRGQLGGRGMAQAGLIMGIIGTVILALCILAVGVFIAFLAAGAFDTAPY